MANRFDSTVISPNIEENSVSASRSRGIISAGGVQVE